MATLPNIIELLKEISTKLDNIEEMINIAAAKIIKEISEKIDISEKIEKQESIEKHQEKSEEALIIKPKETGGLRKYSYPNRVGNSDLGSSLSWPFGQS